MTFAIVLVIAVLLGLEAALLLLLICALDEILNRLAQLLRR